MDSIEELQGLTEQERSEVIKILNEYSDKGYSSSFNKLVTDDYDEIPVDIVTFLHDKRYLGNGLIDSEGKFTIFPYWEEKLKEIFPTNTTTRYNTIILTGAIGLGKSTIAVICLLYLLYRLLCLKDPYLYYGLQPIDKISISLMNITIENAKGVALDKMNLMILSSEWFMNHGTMAGSSNLNFIPDKHIELITASSNNQVIGRAIYSNFTDEVNFGLTADVEKLKKKQKLLISQIDARMKSRFMRGTYLPTLNIIASSKNSDQSFLEDYINTKKKNESSTTLIVDEPQWIVDSRKQSEKHFYVAIGNKFLANELLPLDISEEQLREFKLKGYSILEVPIGYWENFNDNIDGALTDIAGIATASSLKYISGSRWNEIKTLEYQNPFTKEIIEVGNSKDDLVLYQDFFDLNRVPINLKGMPLYIHLDMSISGDKTGIAGVYITGKKPKVEGLDSSRELFFKVAFNVSIKAPKGYEISFDKNRNFIRWLRDLGFSIKGISADTFQSALIRLQLEADNFNVDVISVDRLDSETKRCLPYAYLKSTIYDRRLSVYSDCDFLTEEALGLELQSDGHVNHPELGTKGCFTGDTKISLVDGRDLTLLELVKEFNQGVKNYVYSFNEEKKIIEPKLIENAWLTKKDARLVEVELDNGEKLRCTPDHKFMLRTGEYCEALFLKKDDSLMPLYRKYPTEVVSMKDYRMYYEPIEDAWHYEHRRFASEILDERYLVHHKNCNCRDNSPSNLIWCSKKAHMKIHSDLSTGAQSLEARKKRSKSLSEWYKNNPELASLKGKKSRITLLGFTEESYKKYKEEKDKIKNKLHLHFKEIKELAELHKLQREDKIKLIEQVFNICWDLLSNNEKDGYAVKFLRYNNPETEERIKKAVIENHKLGKYLKAYSALGDCNEESKKLKELYPFVDKDEFFKIFGIEYDSIPGCKRAPWVTKYRKIKHKSILNHKVVSVKYLDDLEDVFDITVQDNHNFALAAGVFVHNSKDAIDAVCGSLWNASKHADEFNFEYGELLDATVDISNAITTDSLNKKLITLDFLKELNKMFDPISEELREVDKLNFINQRFDNLQDTQLNQFYLYNGIII